MAAKIRKNLISGINRDNYYFHSEVYFGYFIFLYNVKFTIWKREEGERFYACAEGSLLILAPWPEDLDAINLRDGHRQSSPLFPRDWIGMMG